jgi:hypothetical protein
MNALPRPTQISERIHRMAPRHELNFLEFLQRFRRGDLLSAADDTLRELVEALALHQGTGSLTLKFGFKVNKAGQLEINPDVTVKKPARALGTGIYFASDDNRLTRRDPNQMDIEDEIALRSGDNS